MAKCLRRAIFLFVMVCCQKVFCACDGEPPSTKSLAAVFVYNKNRVRPFGDTFVVADKKNKLLIGIMQSRSHMLIRRLEIRFSNGEATTGKIVYWDPVLGFVFIQAEAIPDDIPEMPIYDAPLEDHVWVVRRMNRFEASFLSVPGFVQKERQWPRWDSRRVDHLLHMSLAIIHEKGLVGITMEYEHDKYLPAIWMKNALDAYREGREYRSRYLDVVMKRVPGMYLVTAGFLPFDAYSVYCQKYTVMERKGAVVTRSTEILKAGDVVLSINGKAPTDANMVVESMNSKEVTLEIYRQGEQRLVCIPTKTVDKIGEIYSDSIWISFVYPYDILFDPGLRSARVGDVLCVPMNRYVSIEDALSPSLRCQFFKLLGDQVPKNIKGLEEILKGKRGKALLVEGWEHNDDEHLVFFRKLKGEDLCS